MGKSIDINIFGVIGADTTIENIIPEIQSAVQNPEIDHIILRLHNTPGGDVGDAFSIYHALRSASGKGMKITTSGTGFVGSASTLLFMAGDDRHLTEETRFYIHNAYVSKATGNHHDLRALADEIEGRTDAAIRIYAERTGLEEKDLKFLIDNTNEIVLSASDAMALNFATRVFSFKEELLMHQKSMENTSLLTKIKSLLNQNAPQALSMNLENGQTLTIASSGDTAKEGDAVYLQGGGKLEDGKYKAQNGLTLTISGGVISSIEREPVQASASEEVLALIEAQNASIQAQREEIDTLTQSMLVLAESIQSRGFQAVASNPQSTPPPKEEFKGATMAETMRKIEATRRDKLSRF